MYEELTSLLGKSEEVVCEELGIGAEDMNGSDGVYTTPLSVEYAGVKLDVCLLFSELCGLGGFWYEAIYEGEHDKAARDVEAIAKAVSDAMVGVDERAEEKEEQLRSELTADSLVKKFSGTKSYVADNVWDLTEQANTAVRETLGVLKVKFEDAGRIPPECFKAYRSVVFNPDENSVCIRLRYQIGA